MPNQVRWFAAVTLLVGCIALGANAYEARSSSDLMLAAAQNFVASLKPEQRAGVIFPFEQNEWERWHYIPMRNRAGIRYDQMTPDQVRLADTLVSSGLSRVGYSKAKSIMSLEQLVLELEEASGAPSIMRNLRNPDFYYFAIYGEPGDKGVWAWQVEGHHISFNFTINNGRVIASTPMFFGSEPHLVLDGRRKGLSVLAAEENLARELLASLDAKQRAKAIVDDEAPADVLTRARAVVDKSTVPADGIKRSAMTDSQKKLLQALLDEYVNNVPGDLAQDRYKRIEESGDDIHFAWRGSTTPGIGNPYYYRVHGKTFLIEFDNIQLNANHSHSVWRDYENDFGRDLLAEHYRKSHR